MYTAADAERLSELLDETMELTAKIARETSNYDTSQMLFDLHADMKKGRTAVEYAIKEAE